MKKFEWKTIKRRIGTGRKKFIAVTVVLCLVAAAAGGAITHTNKSNAKENKAISVSVGTGTIKESVSGTGSLSYASTTDIVLPTGLEMKEVLVSEGTYVKEGDMLATVDETSLAVCISEVEEAISDLDSTITSKYSSSTTSSIKAGVSGTVEKIYGNEGDDVADVMTKNGALMLVKNGDETIKVIGSEGTISSVNVSEGSSVSASTKVFTLESEAQSGDYLQAVKDREELVSIHNTLISIKKNGGITADIEGMVEAVNVTGSVSGSEVSATTSAETSNATTLASNSNKKDSDSKTVDETNDESDTEIHEIEAVTIKRLSAASSDDSGTVIPEVLSSLKVEAGKIVGTTTDMEYAASENADSWTVCSNEYTEVAKGTWYVRLKNGDSPSVAVKVEVTEDATVPTENAENTVTNNNSQTETTQNTNTVQETTQGTINQADNGNTNDTQSIATKPDGTQSGQSVDNNTTTETGSTENATEGNMPNDVGAGSTKKASTNNSKSGSSNGSISLSGGGSSGSVSISGSSSSSVSSSSDSLVSTQSAFVIANGDKMVVTMNVDELDILSMSEGLSAEITLDAIENETFEGTITNVSQSASGSNGSTQYPVEITFDKTDEMLSGMNASVSVIIKQAEDVLTVPLVAIVDEGKSSYVYTGYDEASGELTGKTEVTLGMSDENSVEITDGLSKGDTVCYVIEKSDSNDKSGSDAKGGMGMPDMSKMPDMPSGGKNGSDRPSFPAGGFDN